MSLGRLSADGGDPAGATALLAPLHAAFSEGLTTGDLRQATGLLEQWAARPPSGCMA